MSIVSQTRYVTLRYVRAFVRQPAWVLITLVQPIIWLLLFGALFKRVIEIPGFQTSSYLDFLAPGVLMMTAINSAGWNGMSFIEDMNRGVMDRLLVSPVWRPALTVGSLVYGALTIAVQSLIIVGITLLAGGSIPGGVGGVLALIVIACLVGATFAALSNALALVARERETLIGAVTLVILPLTFLSGAFMKPTLGAPWIADVARFNPVNWAVEAGRSAAGAHVDWGLVGSRVGYLVLLLAASVWLAGRAFSAYQRSL